MQRPHLAIPIAFSQKMGSPEDKILDYHDVLLRRQDLDLIAAPHWLNDQVIAFFFEYLSLEVYSARSDMLLIPGATTFLLLSAGTPITPRRRLVPLPISPPCRPDPGPSVPPVILDPLGFSAKSLALFAVNNNSDVAIAGGGSHWSLCAYTRADNTLRHFDSHWGTNEGASRALYAALDPTLPPGAALTQAPCPPQQNGYDCGMAVLALTRALCERFVAAQDSSGELSFEVGPEAVAAAALDDLRTELRALILDKSDAQKQRSHR